MLSHRNVITNVEQVGTVFSFLEKDCILGVLPFFHSFGFMATIVNFRCVLVLSNLERACVDRKMIIGCVCPEQASWGWLYLLKTERGAS